MSITREYIDLFSHIADQIDLPKVEGIYLPQLNMEEIENGGNLKKDDFAVVILEDGSAGPFYISLNDTLEQLKNYGVKQNQDALGLIQKFNSSSLPERAIALGAINAVSQHIMSKAGFTTPDKNDSKTSSIGINQAKKGDRIGMIGYFSPLIQRLQDKGNEVLVLEKNPSRVDLETGVILSENVEDLGTCQHILCTASTLINGTLDEVLSHCNHAKSFSLIGPSGSSLPDIIFKHGVDAVGGFHFSDIPALKSALENKEKWGHTGNKYQLTQENYPGIEVLLDRINSNQKL